MKPTNHEIFKFAHKLAKQMKAKWPEDSYRVCFALALRETYRQIEEHNAKAAAKIEPEETAADLAAKRLARIGGKRWTRDDKDRVYFSGLNILRALGWIVTFYKTGNLSSIQNPAGDYVSNCEGRRILGRFDRVYVDLADNSLHGLNEKGDFYGDFQKLVGETIAA